MFKLNSISQILKGGETMKTLGLVLALVLVVGGACVAATATYDIYKGWNMISAPIVPFDPNPETVFAGAPDGVDSLLSRWDPSAGGVGYDSGDPTSFGGVLLGDGFWLRDFTGKATITITGVADGVPDGAGVMTDMWISLPGNTNINGGGWHMIGQPFNHNTPVDDGSGTGANIKFTDGTTLKTWGEAFAAGWVADTISTWDPASGGVGIVFDGSGDDDHFRAGKGYQVKTFVPNLAMIIPASPAD